MSPLKTASFAALLATLSLVPASACDYSMKSHVTADATTPAQPSTDQQTSAIEATAAPSASVETVTQPAPAQTAEAAPTVLGQPKAN